MTTYLKRPITRIQDLNEAIKLSQCVRQPSSRIYLAGWTVILYTDVDGHLTITATHDDNTAPIDITNDIFDWDKEFGIRLTTQHIERQYKESDGDQI